MMNDIQLIELSVRVAKRFNMEPRRVWADCLNDKPYFAHPDQYLYTHHNVWLYQDPHRCFELTLANKVSVEVDDYAVSATKGRCTHLRRITEHSSITEAACAAILQSLDTNTEDY
jgi:hypothetical protein